jgi:sorbose reductase
MAQGPDNKYRSRSVQDLLSLKGKTIVITGGGRGIGLALTRACVEAGGSVAVLDALSEPHEDFAGLKKDFGDDKIEYYKYV